jgi:hypothetical protein
MHFEWVSGMDFSSNNGGIHAGSDIYSGAWG